MPIKILFRLEKDQSGYPPADVEGLWAEQDGHGRFRLDNAPFFVKGVSNRDLVAAYQDGDEWWYERTLDFSGHSTVRIIVYDTTDPSAISELERQLTQTYDCSFEKSGIANLMSVDVPPTTDMDRLFDYLDRGEAQESWTYEVGHYKE